MNTDRFLKCLIKIILNGDIGICPIYFLRLNILGVTFAA